MSGIFSARIFISRALAIAAAVVPIVPVPCQLVFRQPWGAARKSRAATIDVDAASFDGPEVVHHANCSPRRRLQASKLSHDSSYATGAKCLLEWVQDKQIESKVYTPTT
jgi:hypothetical protein